MSSITWPAALPDLPLAQGYSEEGPSLVLRTSMDTGPAKQRRRSSTGTRPVTLMLELTEAQTEALDTFHDEVLEGGALAFEWVHPRTRRTCILRFVGKPPKYTPGGGASWLAQLSLEVMP